MKEEGGGGRSRGTKKGLPGQQGTCACAPVHTECVFNLIVMKIYEYDATVAVVT